MTDAGIDRRYYELCALSELKNSLRSGRHLGAGFTPVQGLRGLPVPPEKFTSLKSPAIAAGRGHRLRTISA